MSLSADLKEKVVKKLFADAHNADWTHLTDGQRSAIYGQWMEDPEVGGRLTQFMSPDRARVWIKDGPMKEYARARYRVGIYAKYVKNSAANVDYLVDRALGAGWQIDPASQKIKPLRVRVRSGDDERYFTWAPSTDLKHLVWAAVRAEAEGDQTPWMLCVVGSFENPTPADEQAQNQRIAARCRLQIVHVDDL